MFFFMSSSDKFQLIEKALQIAFEAHRGQTRKDGSPYIYHPVGVAFTLAINKFSALTVAAALVHDVLEDTPYPSKKFRQVLGADMFKIVSALTVRKSGPWQLYKLRYIESVKNGPPAAVAVSLADQINNLESIISAHAKRGERVWRMFNGRREQTLWFAEEMLKIFRTSVNHQLVKEYELLLKKTRKLH